MIGARARCQVLCRAQFGSSGASPRSSVPSSRTRNYRSLSLAASRPLAISTSADRPIALLAFGTDGSAGGEEARTYTNANSAGNLSARIIIHRSVSNLHVAPCRRSWTKYLNAHYSRAEFTIFRSLQKPELGCT